MLFSHTRVLQDNHLIFQGGLHIDMDGSLWLPNQLLIILILFLYFTVFLNELAVISA